VLSAYITTCADAIALTDSTADPSTDCEQDIEAINEYIYKKTTVTTTWLSTYFNLKRYRETKKMIWNDFWRMTTLIELEYKNYYNYELSETATTLFSSRFFNSYSWLSKLTGETY